MIMNPILIVTKTANKLAVLEIACGDNLSPQHNHQHFLFHFVHSDKVPPPPKKKHKGTREHKGGKSLAFKFYQNKNRAKLLSSQHRGGGGISP